MSEDCVDSEQQAPEDPRFKEEDHEAHITKFPLTAVMKGEEGDGDHRGGSQADGLLAPLSDCDDTTSHSPDTDDEEHSKGDMTCHNSDKRWPCSQCGKTYSSKSYLKVHMRSHEGEKPFSCSDCGKRFAEKGHFNTHRRTHTGEKPFCCSVCGIQVAQKGAREVYVEGFSGAKEEKETRYNVNKEPRVVLHRTDMSEDDLEPEQQAPEDRQIKEEEQPADISKFPPTGVMKSEEGDGDNCGGSQADSLLAPQSYCDNTMSHSPDNDDEEHSKDDMRYRNNDKRWQCSQCGKTFSSKWNLKVHMRSHEGEKPFSCSDCGKRFAEKGHLSRHGRTHSGEKPFCCSVCGVRLAQKINLTIHMRKHTGEKPFVCPFCGKRFSIKGHLKTHTRIHTGEKPFSCSVCNFSFSERSKLVKHTRTHTGEKEFTCSVCDKKFAQRCTLTIHARIHTGEKPFGCSVCDKRFSRKDQIKRHKCAGKNGSK
ncbi:zinc finger protein 84-like [Phycodurus eques]|uniref:zinc finger protein 84-like n=1 Tax=Phycodurus eques TaxID=693459 RepID=UPI002ACD7342|nr:zinc finger protein 84-like [Phycodurus eques]